MPKRQVEPLTIHPRLSGSESHRGYRLADSGNWIVAEVQPGDDGGVLGGAYAALFAAAPDLLKACKQAIVALKGREHDGFLRDAIAKAERRAS